jgi:hypothetical protein
LYIQFFADVHLGGVLDDPASMADQGVTAGEQATGVEPLEQAFLGRQFAAKMAGQITRGREQPAAESGDRPVQGAGPGGENGELAPERQEVGVKKAQRPSDPGLQGGGAAVGRRFLGGQPRFQYRGQPAGAGPDLARKYLTSPLLTRLSTLATVRILSPPMNPPMAITGSPVSRMISHASLALGTARRNFSFRLFPLRKAMSL